MAEQVIDNQKFTSVRLPTNYKPVHYELSLKPNFATFTYEGSVKIEYEKQSDHEKLDQIVLHAQELEINEGFIQNQSDAEQVSTLKKVTYSKDSETATLEFDHGIFDRGDLHLSFKGILNDRMKGFYRTAFKIDNTVVYAATTQFESTDARRCFPCWDEPAVKATFSVSLIIVPSINVNGRDYPVLALSNTPETSRTDNGSNNEVEYKFDKTPIMSTYLLAFIIGPFDKIEGSDGKRPIRVFTTPGKSEQGRFALDVACKSLPYYENYFNIEYPLKKMDLIAIPDFSSGAMENWGLVTYRETCLLVDPKNTATIVKQYVALVVAHELAHQWFGNLVTMEWWTDLWLNEGFATFMEYLCVDHIFPEYDIWSQFLTDAYCPAMSLDSLNNSHPIEVPVEHPSEIEEIFDAISYEKGASVIRMLHNYIGDDAFRKGMKSYLSKYAYKNARTENLWQSLEAESKKPVCKLMSCWTSQKGFPWLSVNYKRDGNDVRLSLTQNKFTADGKVPAEDAGLQWLIPVSAINGTDSTKSEHLLEGKQGEIVIEGAGESWIKLNPGTVGFYRTAYPDEMAKKLHPVILDQSLSPTDRLGLQNDFFSLCQAGKVPTVELLKFLQAFKGETNCTVWRSIDSSIGRLSNLLSNTDYQEKFHKFGINLYSEIFKRLTWEPQAGEKHTNAMTRALVINRLVSFGDSVVIEESKKRYKSHLEQSVIIPADLRGAVYRAVSSHGDDSAFDTLFELYRTTQLNEEKNRVASALGLTKDINRLKRVIDFTFSDEVRLQDKVFFIIPIGASNPSVAFKILQDKKDMLREKYESGHLLRRMVKCCVENFASEERAKEVAKFFHENKFYGMERTVQQSLETIRLSADWLARDNDSIKAFLSA